MNNAIFGPAGNSDSFSAVYKSTVDAPKWLGELGLDAYEYQSGNGVRISEAHAEAIKAEAVKHRIVMSLHSPYYISLTNMENLDKNINYIMQSSTAARAMGAGRIIVHTGSATGRDRNDALSDAANSLRVILREMDMAGYGDLTLCPETMGKINQLGDFDEVMRLCAAEERLIPCVDFGHLYARTLGAAEGYDYTARLLDHMENMIGSERTRIFHAHFSHIEFSKGGEKRHLTFEDKQFGPDFRPLARLLAERKLCPTIICESAGTQAEDALMMKKIYLDALESV